MKPDFGHCCLDGDYSTEKPRLRVADGGRLFQLSFARSRAAEWNAEMFGARFGGVRSKCRGFSYSSRKRMMNSMNSVSCGAPLPAFVTLTFPDIVLAPFFSGDGLGVLAQYSKRQLDSFVKRLLRVSPGASAFWRLEWQSRKSGDFEGWLVPHFHLMVWGLESRPVAGYCDGRLEHFVSVKDKQLNLNLFNLMEKFVESTASGASEAKCGRVTGIGLSGGRYTPCNISHKFSTRLLYQGMVVDGGAERWGYEPGLMSFQDWVSMSWYHVVSGGDINHFTAGARVERVRTWGGVVSYASKYMSKADAQFLGDVPYGRNWGIYNRAAMPWAKMIELELDEETGVRLRRVARRYLEHKVGRKWKAPYGITLFCDGAQFLRLLKAPPDTPF